MTGTPLSDIVVADFTHARAGPWCTELLGELGAEVVKIERPGGGDPNRDGHPKQCGMGFEFISQHRNKKSVVST
jgi:succinate--hydroxymethylglutarate CoA-transferase